jgi:hypothetical protein
MERDIAFFGCPAHLSWTAMGLAALEDGRHYYMGVRGMRPPGRYLSGGRQDRILHLTNRLDIH